VQVAPDGGLTFAKIVDAEVVDSERGTTRAEILQPDHARHVRSGWSASDAPGDSDPRLSVALLAWIAVRSRHRSRAS
jgi:hypothetical protein